MAKRLSMSLEYITEKTEDWNWEGEREVSFIRDFCFTVKADTEDNAIKISELVEEWFQNEYGFNFFVGCSNLDKYDDMFCYSDSTISVNSLMEEWSADSVADVKKEVMKDWKTCKKEVLAKFRSSATTEKEESFYVIVEGCRKEGLTIDEAVKAYQKAIDKKTDDSIIFGRSSKDGDLDVIYNEVVRAKNGEFLYGHGVVTKHVLKSDDFRKLYDEMISKYDFNTRNERG